MQLEPSVAVWKLSKSHTFQQLACVLDEAPISLVGLEISDCNLGKCADDIGRVLSCNVMLEQLNLSHNRLQACGITKIFREITRLKKLKEFILSHNKVSDTAVILSHNTDLELLDWSHNTLQTQGSE